MISLEGFQASGALLDALVSQNPRNMHYHGGTCMVVGKRLQLNVMAHWADRLEAALSTLAAISQ